MPKPDGTGDISLVFNEDNKRYTIVPANGCYPSNSDCGICFQIDLALINTVSYGLKDDHVYLKTKLSPNGNASANAEFRFGFGSPESARVFVEHLIVKDPTPGQMKVTLISTYITPHADDLQPMMLTCI